MRAMNLRAHSWLILGLAAAAVAQGPAPDPNLPAQFKQLKAYVKNAKMDEDLRAADLIEALVQNRDKRNEKDLDKIAESIGEVFKLGKLRPPDNSRLYEQAANSLALLGKRGAKALRDAVDNERFKDRDYAKLRGRLVTAIGKAGDDTQVDFLLEQALRSPDDPVIAAAGEALGNFAHIELPKLREVVKRMISRYGEWVMKATQADPTDPNAPIDLEPQNARRTLAAVRDKWNTTLAKLTGQSYSDAPEWQRWLNKTKDWLPPGRKN